MALRLKNKSSVQKLFGMTGGFGAFANNEIIRNNPQLLKILATKGTRISFRKKEYINPKVLKLSNSAIARKNGEHNVVGLKKVPGKRKEDGVRRGIQVEVKEKGNIKDDSVKEVRNIYKEEEYKLYQWRSKKKDRYYNIYLQPTLLGNYSLVKSWGGIHNHLGNYDVMYFDNIEEACLEIEKISEQRRQRGYQLK